MNVGDLFNTTRDGVVEIINIASSRKVEIRFLNSGNTRVTQKATIVRLSGVPYFLEGYKCKEDAERASRKFLGDIVKVMVDAYKDYIDERAYKKFIDISENFKNF